jgi:hypothetical protein
MLRSKLILLLLAGVAARAAIIDRTAIVVGTRVIKDSDIELDIRVTGFLNGVQPDFSLASRKTAAGRLIDQELIREQIRAGEYPVALQNEATQVLADLKRSRFPAEGQYQRALAQFNLTEAELKTRLLWQLTVLRFIDIRFRPAVIVSDQEIQQYFNVHRTALLRAHAGAKGLDDVKPAIEEQLTGEGINTLLEAWLQQTRKETRIEYLEKSLA